MGQNNGELPVRCGHVPEILITQCFPYEESARSTSVKSRPVHFGTQSRRLPDSGDARSGERRPGAYK